jgi:subtilisin family serine protease
LYNSPDHDFAYNLFFSGVDVLSTFPMKAPCLICDKLEEYGYGTISGTSMATPHVAGVLALLKSFKPDATPEELVGALQNSAEDLGGSGKDRQFGHGLVQAFSAIEYLSGGANASSFSQPTYARTECGEDEVLFDMKLFTDGYSEETYWELRRITDGGVHLSGAGYDDNAAISVEKCIPRNCYTFTMFDSQGDGT